MQSTLKNAADGTLRLNPAFPKAMLWLLGKDMATKKPDALMICQSFAHRQ
jgi:hypothetical protein